MRLKSHNFETLKHYLRNLFLALLGRNPFRVELDELREHYLKTADNVATLTELYYKSQEALLNARERIADGQRLVENLKSRIAENDNEIKRLQTALLKSGLGVDYYGKEG